MGHSAKCSTWLPLIVLAALLNTSSGTSTSLHDDDKGDSQTAHPRLRGDNKKDTDFGRLHSSPMARSTSHRWTKESIGAAKAEGVELNAYRKDELHDNKTARELSVDFCANDALNFCHNLATCVLNEDSSRGYDCLCEEADGVTGDPFRDCKNYDECANAYPCAPVNQGGFCVDSNPPVKFTCGCRAGFEAGTDTDPIHGPLQCLDMNECTLGIDDCDRDHGVCTNTVGSFDCSCDAESNEGDGNNCIALDNTKLVVAAACDSCNEINEICGPNDVCICAAGFYSPSGAGGACQDLPNCDNGNNNCDPNAECQELDGSFLCLCVAGYTGNGLTCHSTFRDQFEYIRGVESDRRGPCPAINGLANHGIINRNGRLVKLQDLIDGLALVYEVTESFLQGPANTAIRLGLTTGSMQQSDFQGNFLDIETLGTHTLQEHDSSLVRPDFYFCPAAFTDADEGLIEALLSINPRNDFLTRDDISAYQRERILDSRIRNPEADYAGRLNGFAAQKALIMILGQDQNLNRIGKARLQEWLQDERIPLGYQPSGRRFNPSTRVGDTDRGAVIRAEFLAGIQSNVAESVVEAFVLPECA